MKFQPDAIDSKSELMEMLGKPTSPDIANNNPKPSENEFSEQSAAFWSIKGKDLSNAYEKGIMMSNFNPVSRHEYENVLVNFVRLTEEILRDELNKKGQTLDEIKNILKSLEELMKVLSYNIDVKIKPQEMSAKTLIAALHGFINSYAEKIK